MTDTRFPVPRTAPQVIHHLATMGPRTAKQIRESLGMARRTLYGALRYLTSEGMVIERPYLRDTRMNVYVLVKT